MNNLESHLYEPNWRVYPCPPPPDSEAIPLFHEFLLNQSMGDRNKVQIQMQHLLQILYTHWTGVRIWLIIKFKQPPSPPKS